MKYRVIQDYQSLAPIYTTFDCLYKAKNYIKSITKTDGWKMTEDNRGQYIGKWRKTAIYIDTIFLEKEDIYFRIFQL